ncbi:hypothetical protein NHX12_026758 [Muraenolepis orangiensis]|uniref:Bcl-2-modifying factor n=1 Tax=Muraenolepis orangiensis TaxID=630683 RepID=A0A9Q0EK48_9TELE|nr:hypothetical protein NHX12_026758 [Muraenolepis orangiensis]
MDDEEEDMALQPTLSQLWVAAPYRHFKTDPTSPLRDTPLGIHRGSQHWGPRLHENCGFPPRLATSSSRPHSEPMEDRGERPEERVGVSVEVEIGRKLREIGDQFDQHHSELLRRHQREVFPVWMRLAAALMAFLFPREPPLVPQLRGQQR